jgi:beta-glucosidase
MVGQVPIYYGQKNTGKPPCPESIIHIDQIPVGTPQTSLGMSSFHLDAGYKPLYPFGFGLSYTEFEYDNLKLSAEEIPIGGSLTVSVDVTNAGEMPADEVVQLYVRDLVANVTRPVKELKGFRRIPIEPGQTVSTEFELHTDDLAFFGRDNTLIVEPGDFHLWVGGASDSGLRAGFALVAKDSPDGAA